MKTAQRKDIIKDIHRRTEGLLTLKEVELVVSLYGDSISDFLSEGYKVQLTGLYSIEPVIQSPRKGRHIKTGERLNVPEKPAAKFRPGRGIKRAMRELTVEDIRVANTVPSDSPALIDRRAKTGPNFGKKDTRKQNLDKINKTK